MKGQEAREHGSQRFLYKHRKEKRGKRNEIEHRGRKRKKTLPNSQCNVREMWYTTIAQVHNTTTAYQYFSHILLLHYNQNIFLLNFHCKCRFHDGTRCVLISRARNPSSYRGIRSRFYMLHSIYATEFFLEEGARIISSVLAPFLFPSCSFFPRLDNMSLLFSLVVLCHFSQSLSRTTLSFRIVAPPLC